MTSRFAILILFLATLIAWIPGVIHASFIWDDDQYVTENDNLESVSGLIEAWTRPRSLPQYYPLTHTTFFLERALAGENPRVFRAVNVLLHALSAILLYVILRRLALPGALFAALLFAVHPLQAESVLWITERKNTLSLVLALAALLRLLAFGEGRGRRDYVIALLFFAAALAAKTVVCALPAVYLILRWYQHRISRRDVVAMIPFFALGALAAWFTGHLESTLVGAKGAAWDLGPLLRLAIAGRALLFYAGKLLWPTGLSFNYERWEMTGSALDLAWALAALLPLVAALLLHRRGLVGRGPIAAFLLFGGLLVPALGFVNVYPMRYSFVADHFQYHAGPALLALLAATAVMISRRLPHAIGIALAACVITALGFASWQRADAYGSEEALWRDTIAGNPKSFLAHHNLGDLLRRRGDLEGALRVHETARDLRPDLGELHTEIAVDLEALGRREEALEHFESAVAAAPRDPRFRLNLARAFIHRGRAEDALREIEQAGRFIPESGILRGLRGAALLARGRLELALPDLEAAAKAPGAELGDQMNLSIVIERLKGPAAALAALPEPLPEAMAGRRPQLLMAVGDLAAAFAAFDVLVAAGRREPDLVLSWIYLLATRRGPPDPAALDQAVALLADLPAHESLPGLVRARATLAARRGDFSAASLAANAGLELARRRNERRDQELFESLIDIYGRGSLLLIW